jgi:AbrB family looped-hinge helix DNA binding protein
MTTIRVGRKRQITIPRQVFEGADLEVGDILEATVDNGKVVLTPKRLTDKVLTARLSPSEQRAFARAQKKIKVINEDPLNSRGLTRKEAEAAAKAGVIRKDQTWFWLERWQKGEREAERDIREGNVYGPFETAEEMIAELHRLCKEE